MNTKYPETVKRNTYRTYRHVVIIYALVCWLLGGLFFTAVNGQENSASENSPKGLITISGDSLEIDNDRKIATYTGNVKVIQDEMNMTSDKLLIYFGEAENTLDKTVATGNVHIERGDITASGEAATFYNEEQTLEIEGMAKVIQENNIITGHRIIVFLEQDILEGSGNASQRVVTTVVSSPQVGEEQSQQERSPIVVEADSLRLDNSAQEATYTGNVIVTQDATEISSDTMLIFFQTDGEAGNEIQKIEVHGHVRVVRENMIVTGEKGVYLNKEQQAIIEGTAEQKARAEDQTQNRILEAPIIEASLATNTIKARGRASMVIPSSSQEPVFPNNTSLSQNESQTTP